MPFIGKQSTSGFASLAKQTLTADGSTTVFTLNENVASANSVEVFVGNVRQEPSVAYTTSGNQLTFTAAPASGVDVYVIFQGGLKESESVPKAGTTVPGNFGVSGDLNVDTNVLHVDSASNRVGMGVDPSTMPSFITQSIKTTNGGGLGISSDNLTDNRWIFFGHGTASSDIQRASILNTSSELQFHTATVKRMTIDSDGHVTTPYVPTFQFNGTPGVGSSGTLGVGQIDFQYATEALDNGNNANSSGQFTAPVDGYYFFAADIGLFAGGSGYVRDAVIRIRKNGSSGQTTNNQLANVTGSNDHATVSQSAIFSLASGDTVDVQMTYVDHSSATFYSSTWKGFLIG